MMKGDSMDLKLSILSVLEKNAKTSVEDLAKMLGVDEEDIVTAVGELEADRVICGYNAIINWDKVSNEKVAALIEVKVAPQRGVGFDKIGSRIARFDEVDSIYLLSGGYDFLIRIKGRSMKEVSQFVFDKLSTLESVQSTATHFVLKKYKDHGVLMEERHENERDNVIL